MYSRWSIIKENMQMGFFDRDVTNSFDKMFDLDRDGSLDAFEQAMQFDFIDRVCSDDSSESDSDDYDEIMDEIEGMDEEAREFLESEGYDTEDYGC